MTRAILSIFLFSAAVLPLCGQTSIDASGAGRTIPWRIPNNVPGTCVVGEVYWDTAIAAPKICSTANTWTALGVGSGGATASYQLTDLSVTRTSSTVLTIGAGCTPATPCPVKFGDQVRNVTASATSTLTSGSGTELIWIDTSGAINVGIPAAGMADTCSGCTSQTGTSFPNNSTPVYTWTATSGTWDVSGGTSMRAFIGAGKALTPGTGCSSFTETATGIVINCGGSASYVPRFYALAQDAPGGGGCQYGTGFVYPAGNDFPHHSATIGSGVDNCTIAMPSTGASIIFSVWWDGTTALTANIVWLEDTATVALAQFGVSVACPAAQNASTFSTPVTGTGTPASIGQFMTTSIVPSMGTCSGAGMIYVKVASSAAGSGTTYTHAIDLVGISI